MPASPTDSPHRDRLSPMLLSLSTVVSKSSSSLRPNWMYSKHSTQETNKPGRPTSPAMSVIEGEKRRRVRLSQCWERMRWNEQCLETGYLEKSSKLLAGYGV